MSLKTKVLAGTALLWISFIVISLTSILTSSYPILVICLAGFLSLLGQLALLFFLILKPIEKINLALEEKLREQNFREQLSMKLNGGFKFIVESINTLIAIAHASEEKTILRVQARTLKLENQIDDLKKDIHGLESTNKKIQIHNERLIESLHHDPVTELANRIYFSEILNEKIKEAQRINKKLALVTINLDNFKSVNDSLGNFLGDKLLKEVTSHLQSTCRTTDILARTGGAEFCILLDDVVHAEVAGLFADKILQLFSQPLKIEHKTIQLTPSIGIAVFPRDGVAIEKLLKNADTAMFKAKADGGGVYAYFTKDMSQELNKLSKLSHALEGAIKKNELVLYYQPKLNLKTHKIVGVEALLRWESAVLGLVTPSRFLPLAEETGKIAELGEWVLREACRNNKTWQKQGFQSLPIAVNLSKYQFHFQNISELIQRTLNETGLDPSFLQFEIDSPTIMENLDLSAKVLESIRDTGVSIIIDNFGDGTISLNSLKKLPISGIKIDPKFIKDIPTDENNLALVNSLISLARNLKLEVIATGIETIEQLDYLANNHCINGQGYFFNKPLPEFSFMSTYFYGSDDRAQK